MQLVYEYTKNYCKEMIRNPSALFFTLFFPAFLFLMFYSSNNATESFYVYVVYCNFAVQTVMLQALGISVSSDRANEWTQYLKTLPTNRVPAIAGRIISYLLFAFISLTLVIAINYYMQSFNLPFYKHAIVILCALVGGIPMALLAIFLARFLNPNAAKSAFVVVNTLLLFGAFSFVDAKGVIAMVANFIPTYQWLQFSIAAVNFSGDLYAPLAWLIGYAITFSLLIFIVKDKQV